MKRIEKYIDGVILLEQDFYGSFNQLLECVEKPEYFEVVFSNKNGDVNSEKIYKEDLDLLGY